MEKTANANGLAILNVLKAHKGETLAYAEIANLAGIKAQTGYLTSARALADKEHLAIIKVKDGVKVTIKTVTVYASGLEVEKVKEDSVDGYILADAE